MRSRWMPVVTALGVLGLAPLPAGADDVQEQLQQMQQRLDRMEDRLQATTDQLEAANQRVEQQHALIERSGIADGTGASSGLASFLESLEIGGWLNGSYWYNVDDPDNDDLAGANTGAFGQSNFFNPDHNTFALDQLWFELERPVDDSNRAGFGADIVFGKTARLLNDLGTGSGDLSGGELDLYVHQAYVQYLAPIGNGVKFTAGKFATLIGYEVVGAPYNDQISRGIVWQNLQPIDHVGVLVSTGREGWEAAVGLVNGFAPEDPDVNDGKTVAGRIGYAGESFSVMLNGLYGAEAPGNEHPKTGVGNLVVTLDPSDRLSLWADGTFLRNDPDPLTSSGDQHAWGAAVGGRLALTDRTGFALRGEYLEDDGALISGSLSSGRPIDATLYTVTGTLDHRLTDNLVLRGEVRWDTGRLKRAADDLFVDDEGPAINFSEKDQMLVGMDVTYLFN